MGYALEIGAYEPSKLQALLAEIPWSTRFIDDDIMTLYCVLYNVPLYRVHAPKGGRQDTPIDRFFRAGLNSRRNREVLRRHLEHFAMNEKGVVFNLDTINPSCFRVRLLGRHIDNSLTCTGLNESV